MHAADRDRQKIAKVPVPERETWAEEAALRLKKLLRKCQQLRIAAKQPTWFIDLAFEKIPAPTQPARPAQPAQPAQQAQQVPPEPASTERDCEEGAESEFQTEPDEVVDLDDDDAQPAQTRRGCAADLAETVPQFSYRFDNVCRRGYRLPAGDSTAARDYGTMKEADNAQDTDPMLTLWPGGSSWAVPQYTTGMHRAAVGTPKAAKINEIAGYDGQVVSIEMRWNAPKGKRKQRLCSVKHGGKQVFHMDCMYFADNEEQTEHVLSRARGEVCEAGDE